MNGFLWMLTGLTTLIGSELLYIAIEKILAAIKKPKDAPP